MRATLLVLAGFAVLIMGLDFSLVAGSTVTVSATVAESITCSTNTATTAFGTLDSGSVSTSTPNASTTISCNTGLGCTLNVQDANTGLATTSPAYTIASADATLSAGTEGYGIQATTTASGSGGTLGIPAKFNKTGNAVGGLATGNAIIASSTASVSGRENMVTHKAAISGTTQAASYADTITYSCTAN